MRIANTVNDSIVDGHGLRFTIFTQGCPHHCPGCHNPDTHDPAGGREGSLAELIAEGYEDRLFLSHDFTCYPLEACERAHPERNPAESDGLSCIHEEAVPALRNHGVTETQIRKLLHDNPRRLLCHSFR